MYVFVCTLNNKQHSALPFVLAIKTSHLHRFVYTINLWPWLVGYLWQAYSQAFAFLYQRNIEKSKLAEIAPTPPILTIILFYPQYNSAPGTRLDAHPPAYWTHQGSLFYVYWVSQARLYCKGIRIRSQPQPPLLELAMCRTKQGFGRLK